MVFVFGFSFSNGKVTIPIGLNVLFLCRTILHNRGDFKWVSDNI